MNKLSLELKIGKYDDPAYADVDIRVNCALTTEDYTKLTDALAAIEEVVNERRVTPQESVADV